MYHAAGADGKGGPRARPTDGAHSLSTLRKKRHGWSEESLRPWRRVHELHGYFETLFFSSRLSQLLQEGFALPRAEAGEAAVLHDAEIGHDFLRLRLAEARERANEGRDLDAPDDRVVDASDRLGGGESACSQVGANYRTCRTRLLRLVKRCLALFGREFVEIHRKHLLYWYFMLDSALVRLRASLRVTGDFVGLENIKE